MCHLIFIVYEDISLSFPFIFLCMQCVSSFLCFWHFFFMVFSSFIVVCLGILADLPIACISYAQDLLSFLDCKCWKVSVIISSEISFPLVSSNTYVSLFLIAACILNILLFSLHFFLLHVSICILSIDLSTISLILYLLCSLCC